MELTPIKTINCLTINPSINYKTTSIIILKDGRLSSCGTYGWIFIYNKNDFTPEIEIYEPYYFSLVYHTQLSNSNILYFSDRCIKIIEIKDNNTYSHIQGFGGHNYQIIKVIELKNNQLLSYSIDQIKIWKKDNKNLYFCEKTIDICVNRDNSLFNVLFINDRQLMTCVSHTVYDLTGSEQIFTFWKILEDFNLEKNSKLTLHGEGLNLNLENNFILIKNIIIFGCGRNENGIGLIDTKKSIYKGKLCKNISNIKAIQKLSNGNIIVSGDKNKNMKFCLIEYEINLETNELNEIGWYKFSHDSFITMILELDNKIITSSYDCTVKIWERKIKNKKIIKK